MIYMCHVCVYCVELPVTLDRYTIRIDSGTWAEVSLRSNGIHVLQMQSDRNRAALRRAGDGAVFENRLLLHVLRQRGCSRRMGRLGPYKQQEQVRKKEELRRIFRSREADFILFYFGCAQDSVLRRLQVLRPWRRQRAWQFVGT